MDKKAPSVAISHPDSPENHPSNDKTGWNDGGAVNQMVETCVV
jgi:hypothetical protein